MTKKYSNTTQKLRQLLKGMAKQTKPKIKPGETAVTKKDYDALIEHLNFKWLHVKGYFYGEHSADYNKYYDQIKKIREELTNKKALMLFMSGVRLRYFNDLLGDCKQLEDVTGGNMSTWEHDKFWSGLIRLFRTHLYKPEETQTKLLERINKWYESNWEDAPRYLGLPHSAQLSWDQVCAIVDDACERMEADLSSPITLDRVEAGVDQINKVLDKYHKRS